MDELKQRIVQRVLTEVDSAVLADALRSATSRRGLSGERGIGRMNAHSTVVQELVAAFGASLMEEDVRLSANARRELIGQVVEEVLSAHKLRTMALDSPQVPPTVARLERWGTWNKVLIDYLQACMVAGRSVLISGGAGAGKSTLLSVMASLASDSRLVSVEREAQLEIEHEHVVRLQGSEADLLEKALALAPERLVLDGIIEEAALAALQTMAAVPTLATIEGASAESVTERLVEMAQSAAPGLSVGAVQRLVADNVDVVVGVAQMLDGSRRVTEVVEVLSEPEITTGLRFSTVLQMDQSGQLAATGNESAFVTSTFLRKAPPLESVMGAEGFAPEAPEAPDVHLETEVTPEMPVEAELTPEAAIIEAEITPQVPAEAAIVEVEALPLPPVEEVDVPTPVEPEPKKRKGLFGRREKAAAASALGGSRASSKKAPTLGKAKSAAARGAAIAATTEQTVYETEPLVQVMTTYLVGDDLYEESYSIEEGVEFLGEMGVSIAHTLGEGSPKQVAGFEVWMFDKETLQTPTSVVLSDGAYADEGIRASHEEKGEVLVATPGQQTVLAVLDTGVLRLEARVKGVELDPDGQSFERGTVELAVWRSGTVGAGVEEAIQIAAIEDTPVDAPVAPVKPEAKKRKGLFGRREKAPAASALGGSRASSKRAPTLGKAKSAAARGAAIAATTEQTVYETEPLVQVMTTYLVGDDLYEESYSIEEGVDFLGEMGVSIAHTIGEGSPKQVVGFEVWMFDKETLQTPTSVVLSDGAYADEGIRASHEEKGEVLAATPGQQTVLAVLDTGVLRLEARVKDVELNEDGQSFARGTIELAAWHVA